MVILSGILLPLVRENRLDELEEYLKTSNDPYSTACCMEEASKTANYSALELMLKYGVNPTYPYLDPWKNAKDVTVLEKLLPATLPLINDVLEYSPNAALHTLMEKAVELNAENVITTLLENGASFSRYSLYQSIDKNYTELAKKIIRTSQIKIDDDIVDQIINKQNMELIVFCEPCGEINFKNEVFFKTSVGNSLEMFKFMLDRGNVVTGEIIDKSCAYPQIFEYILQNKLFPEEVDLSAKLLLKTIGDFNDQCVSYKILELLIDHCEMNKTYGAALYLLIAGFHVSLVKKMIEKGEEILPGHELLAECLKIELK